MATKDTKALLIKTGMGIIARQGFNATGIETILRQANVPKGSFYHYFSSKKDFGLQVLDHFAAGIDRIFNTYLLDETLTPLNRLRACVENLVVRFETNNCNIGCLVANLGQEMADQDEEFRERLAGVFATWTSHFEACLQAARDAGEIHASVVPVVAAELFLSGFEGALLLAKVKKSSMPVHTFIDAFFRSVLRCCD
jgi:TetR/AcrR family transcriptional regulator, transcriptional repressor for nem operon